MRDLERDYRPSDTAAAELVVSFVRGQIERRLLTPGDRLPSERELAARIGVSRPSVRAGLRSLSAMGVVQTRRGSGTYITEEASLDARSLGLLAVLHRFSPEQISEARRVLEQGIAGLAAERADSAQMVAMAEEVAAMFAAVDEPATFLAHDMRFHRALAVGSGNPVLVALAEMVSTLHFEQRRRTVRTREQLSEVAMVHRTIYHAVRARDPERARREMSEHLSRARQPAPEGRRQLTIVNAAR